MDKLIVAASTHWDREWYRTFQDFQIRLCDLVNQVLDLLEKDEEFLCYTFDGQAVVLDDYLEIFPENEERIRTLVKAGRLVFGPLYNLPDEFLSGGEGLIRNFLIGDEMCRKIGGKMNAGYVPDNFGHISQLPQILRGVGLDTVFFFRGTNIETLKKKEFYWIAPDGSSVLGEYMLLGYWSLKSWGDLGVPVEDHFLTAYNTLKRTSRLGTVLLINGSDHLYQDPDFTKKLKAVRDAFPDLSILNGSIEDYADLAKAAAKDVTDLPVIHGELRDFRYGPDPTSVTSSRSPLKRLLFTTLAEIERYAEPLASMAASFPGGEAYPTGFFRKIWKRMLTSLAHDGVAGCSIDDVMKDIETYIIHARQTARRIVQLKLEALVGRLDTRLLGEDEQYLVLYNPHPFPYTGITRQRIAIAKGEPGYKDFRIRDMEGQDIPYELVSVSEDIVTQEYLYSSKEGKKRTVYEVLFRVEDLPPMGIHPYVVAKSRMLDKRLDERYVRLQGSHPVIENQYYRIRVNQDASISVLDRESGKWHENLNCYVGRGEVGDEYQHVSPLFDLHTFAELRSVAVVNNSPLSQRLRITAEMLIPDGMDKRMIGRGRERKVCRIETDVAIYDGVRRIDIDVVIDNPSSDHILYAKFPTSFKEGRDYSYVSFDEVVRDNTILGFDPGLKSTQSLLKPMQKYAGVKGKDGSLNIAAKGVYEYHTKETPEGMDFYVTLLRSTSYLFHGLPLSWLDLQHTTTPVVATAGSKELGKSALKYALFLNVDKMAREAETYLYPVWGIDVIRNEEAEMHVEHDRSTEEGFSFIRIDSEDVILSAMKKPEHGDGVLIRVYNLRNEQVETTIRTLLTLKDCRYCDLLERPTGQADFSPHEVKLVIGAKKITTLWMEWRDQDGQD
jgi:alpha-mannosidase